MHLLVCDNNLNMMFNIILHLIFKATYYFLYFSSHHIFLR
jgi:hypothetical protein